MDMKQADTINAENFASVDLDENYFKFATFEDISPEGGLIASDFNICTFRRIDWYWGLFSDCNFIQCEFKDCIFRGTSFPGCRFIECAFKNCQFVTDNLNGKCDLEESVAYGCTVENCTGFNSRIVQ
jgi:uncharacterized protein YjbI with pentapeptide repeats